MIKYLKCLSETLINKSDLILKSEFFKRKLPKVSYVYVKNNNNPGCKTLESWNISKKLWFATVKVVLGV